MHFFYAILCLSVGVLFLCMNASLCFVLKEHIYLCVCVSVCVRMWVENLRHVTAGGPMPSGKEKAERGAVVAMETPPCGSWSGSVKSQPAERETAEQQNQRKEKKERKKLIHIYRTKQRAEASDGVAIPRSWHLHKANIQPTQKQDEIRNLFRYKYDRSSFGCCYAHDFIQDLISLSSL